ncbi:glycoside hydrolase family 95 protein [Rhodanobacter caeni]|uniref:Glycoside hydrolase family 95 protein n=1 Tax=Rhodanobacter caeni TaxID=657654 RepID=A0ABP3DV03_9GAMM
MHPSPKPTQTSHHKDTARRTGWGLLIALAALLLGSPAHASRTTLVYDKPASQWNEALPLGNGLMGAMVFGGVPDERLQLNLGTLWGGAPNDYIAPGAATRLRQMQQLVFSGQVAQAEALSAGFMGDPALLMPFQPFADLRLHFPDQGKVSDYRRELRLDDAISTVSYTVGDVHFRREAFISYPDRVLVMRLGADRPAAQNVTVALASPQPGAKVALVGANTIELSGQIQPRANPASSWTGSWSQPGISYAGKLVIKTEGGSIHKAGDHLEISGADAVTLVFSGATSFRSYRDIGGDAVAAAGVALAKAARKGYDALKHAHLADYRALFDRVHLRLGNDASSDNVATDQRIRDFKTHDDPSLVALYYQYGRYLLIASSRAGGQPANLQGIWNPDLLPAWGSKWTTNINLEMNYWPAETGDLGETQTPLWDLIDDLQVAGAKTARRYYGARGWVLHHNTDLWRATTPVDGPWGLWPMGGVWLSNQMWDHYAFSGDEVFLRDRAYPAMKGAAQFVLDFLVEAPKGSPVAGKLVTNPSTSPENRYLLDGKPAGLTYAPTMDIELINDLFDHVRAAAGHLGVDTALVARIDAAQSRLPPLQIGHKGQLQEWIEDYAETEPDHRHVSHLYALYPGNAISPDRTPALASAAKRSLQLRGDGGTGWARAWKIALWARLGDGDHASTLLHDLIAENTLPNMFDDHPPFQIDGNFGGTAAIAEMLLQSRIGEVTVLPALPARWHEGEVDGLRARGGVRVGITWRNGIPAEVRLSSKVATSVRIRYRDQALAVTLEPGKTRVVEGPRLLTAATGMGDPASHE